MSAETDPRNTDTAAEVIWDIICSPDRWLTKERLKSALLKQKISDDFDSLDCRKRSEIILDHFEDTKDVLDVAAINSLSRHITVEDIQRVFSLMNWNEFNIVACGTLNKSEIPTPHSIRLNQNRIMTKNKPEALVL